MNRLIRRIVVGSSAGAIAGVALRAATGNLGYGILLGIILGALYAVALQPTRRAYVDSLMTAAAFAIPAWALISVIAIPVLSGSAPEWSAEAIRLTFPSLVGWVLYGALLGLFVQTFSDLAHMFAGPEVESATPPAAEPRRILILGGGFAGMTTAESLEKEFRGDLSVSISLVSDTNALLFTPMLAEVAGSSLEPSHISTPLRSSLHRTEFIRGRAGQIDLEQRRVVLEDAKGSPGRSLAYDHLVLALGSVSNYFGNSEIEAVAFNFKGLLDAIRIRNHVIEMFEQAERQADPDLRRALLTFVIAGGGFAGVELAGALNDFAHGILADYPKLSADELCVMLVHSQDKILPELSPSLGQYAQRKMAERGVVFRMKTRVTGAKPGLVSLSDGEVHAQTLVWTAGTAPSPLLKQVPIEKDKRGAAIVDSTLCVPGQAGLWAVGDCASVKDAKSGKPCPPTAQFALREAQVLAKNIWSVLNGKPTKGFHFDSLGALCVVGHQTACAELTVPFARNKSLRFSGLLAWIMWRGIYLAKLPGTERKLRVLMDWTVELFFPRDIVQTIDLQ